MTTLLLIFNVGSSTLRVAACAVDALAAPVYRLSIDLATRATCASGSLPGDFPVFTQEHSLEDMVIFIVSHARDKGRHVVAVAHRVVHGGHHHREPLWVTAELLRELETFEQMRPLHQPPALEVISHLRKLWPDLPQLAVFDTSFHQQQPALATTYALPEALRRQGIAHYGFHGISCQHVMRWLTERHAELADGRVLVAHLGQSASLTAVHYGNSVACSMGFSTLDGVPMGSRCGELDAGVLLYLLEQGWSKSRLGDLLYHRSGLLGLSGISADMRELLASDTDAARFAVDYFCYRAARMVASLACAMEGLETLVFTGAIGEQQPLIREKTGERLRWMGVEIDSIANHENQDVLSSTSSSCRIVVVPTDEEGEMNLQCRSLLLQL